VLNGWPEWEWDPTLGAYTWVAHEEWRLYKSAGDTSISATNYKKIMTWPLNYDRAGNFSTTAPASGFFRLAYRNDHDKRAYRVMDRETTEEL
jgi:hypothetical protein